MIKPDLAAAINAIKKRILNDFSTKYSLDDVIKNWLVLTHSLFRSPVAQYFPTDTNPYIEDGLYTDEFFNRWVDRFPKSTRKMLIDARTDLEARPIMKRDFSVQVITKIEKSGYIDLAWPRKDARAVNNCTPRANAATGPYYWAFSLKLKDTMSGGDKFALWTPGRSSEYVGEFFDSLVTLYSSDPETQLIFGVGDQSAFDGHQNAGSHNFETAMFKRAGITGVLPAHLLSAIPFGRHQKYPIVFNAGKPARVSGQGKTSSANVSVNFAAVCFCLGEPGPRTWGGLFNGDDILIVTTKRYVQPYTSTFQDDMNKLGLEMEINWTTHVHEVEFCQTLPYPTADGTIFAPKIGRLMARVGVSTSFKDPSIKSIAMGLFVTCYHVPFIKQLLVRLLCLTDKYPDVYMKDYKFHPQLNNFASKPHETIGTTWDFISDRYGLTHLDLEIFTNILNQVVELPSVIEWPLINSLVNRDE